MKPKQSKYLTKRRKEATKNICEDADLYKKFKDPEPWVTAILKTGEEIIQIEIQRVIKKTLKKVPEFETIPGHPGDRFLKLEMSEETYQELRGLLIEN